MKHRFILFLSCWAFCLSAQSPYNTNHLIKVNNLDGSVRYDTLHGYDAGRKFVACVIPDHFERDTIVTLDTLAYAQKRVLSYTFTPPQYDSLVETIELRPAYTFYEIDKKAKLPKGVVLVPPTWGIATTRFKFSGSIFFARFEGIDMFGNDKDCIGFLVLEIPQEYITTYRRELKTPALLVQNRGGQQVVDTLKLPSPYLKTIKVNAWKCQKTTYLAKEPATISIHATTNVVPNNIKGFRLKREGRLSELREHIVCHGLDKPTIRAIQKSLRKKGYWWVKTTNLFDVRTKKALVSFQKKHFLPVGNLNEETLKALDAHQFVEDGDFTPHTKIVYQFKTTAIENHEPLDDLILLQALTDEKISELAYVDLKTVKTHREALRIKRIKQQRVVFLKN